MTPPGRESDSGLVACAAALIGAIVSLRMLVTYETMPGWSSDPTIGDVAIGTAIGPAMRLALDAAMMLAGALVLVIRWKSGDRTGRGVASTLAATLTAAGLVAAIYHLGFNPHASLEDWLGTSDLAAGFSACAAAAALVRGGRAHRVLAAVVVGAVIVVTAKGLLQYFVEHDQTVAAFKASRDQILASNGWEPGSPAALAYERRLLQREATGWFGLSNVFASVVGAGALALAGMALGASTTLHRRILLAAAAVAALGLGLSASKGGIAAAVIAGVVLAALTLLRRGRFSFNSSRWVRVAVVLLPLAMVAAGQLAILARGRVGERIGELSLLFRWFYIRGAARIFAEHPVTGVGTAGFKDAYMIAKVPIAPEDVASPHSWPWDLVATLGLGGAALLVAWLVWLISAGKTAASVIRHDAAPAEPASTDPATADAAAIERRIIFAACAAAGIACVWVERTATAPETAVMKLTGIAAWIVVSVIAASALRQTAAMLGLVAAACSLALHSQIEMTPVWIGSAAWFMVVIGLAAAGSPSTNASAAAIASGRAKFVGSMSLAALVLMVAVALVFVVNRARLAWQWQSLVEQAAERAVQVTRLQIRLQEALHAPTQGERTQQVERVCSDFAIAPPAGRDLAQWAPGAVNEAAAALWPGSLADLLVAAGMIPGYEPLRESASRLAMRLAFLPDIEERDRYVRVAIEESQAASRAGRNRVSGLAWHATVMLELVDRGLVAESDGIPAARASLLSAHEADPYNFQHAVRLAKADQRLGRSADSQQWARKALALEELARLDPLKRMDDATRREMNRLAAQ